MQLVISWFLSFIVALAPPDRRQYLPAARESTEEASARYEGISNDVLEVVYDRSNPSIFKGSDGRAKTAALVLSVMWFESQFRKDVDFGIGDRSRGDNGKSWCLMQIQTGTGRTWAWNAAKGRFAVPTDPPGDVVSGWTGEELANDRKKCVLAGLRIMKMSFDACASMPVKDRLRVYASGSCERGARESNHRVGLAMRWYAAHPSPANDEAVLAELDGEQEPEIDPMDPVVLPEGVAVALAPLGRWQRTSAPVVDFLLPSGL